MKPVYAARCSFHGDAEQNASSAWELACAWLKDVTELDHFGAVESVGSGSQSNEAGHTASWRVTEVDENFVGRIVHDIPAGREELGWRTIIWVCRDEHGAWGIVRGGPQNTAGVVTRLRFDAKRPRLLSGWLEGLHVVADERRLGEQALNYGKNDVPSLVELLQRPTRRLPVVAISQTHVDGNPRTLLRPENLAYRLAGNAHVVVLDHAGSWALTNAIDKPLSVFGGAVRLWWPGLTASDDPYSHPLILADRVMADPRWAAEAIVRRVWRAAVDALGPPALEAKVLTARRHAESERRLATLRSKTTESGEWEDLLKEEFAENDQLRLKLEESQAEVDELKEALAEAQAQVDEDVQDELEEVGTVEDAVKVAAAELNHVLFLESAYAPARESQYPKPQQVLQDLRALGRVAETWGKGELTSDFRGGFDTEPVMFMSGISQTATTSYRSDYEIVFGGQRVLMGPHLRRGTGTILEILRIYWYVDQVGKNLIVGHVGKKLRDKSNH